MKQNIQNKYPQIKLIISSEGDLAPIGREFDVDRLLEELGVQAQAFITRCGLTIIEQILEEEVRHLTGGGGKHSRHENGLDRWGSQSGYVLLPDGQKVPIRRPRVRNTTEGTEVALTSYGRFQRLRDRAEAVYKRLVSGISTRNYRRAIEAVSDGYGISKSVISRQMIEATEAKLKEFLERSLADFDLAILVIDGIRLGNMHYVTALGIDREGKKRILGFQEGATENRLVCTALLEDLAERGLAVHGKPIFYLLDGAKALTSAVERFSGPYAFIQRCQVHKERNVLSRLPEKYHGQVKEALRDAYQKKTYGEAKACLETLLGQLRTVHPSAAASLAEGLEQTLTAHRLGLPPQLRQSLRSTNMIESMFSNHRHLMRNVRRWSSPDQRPRWLATCFLETEKTFARIQGYRSIPVLIEAMEQQLITDGILTRPHMA